ncbi:hypothetical protein H5410_002374 [Solanum commersonii]|uniref:Cytochrome b5 heme-binding domain-containing protein n=1 Tax=Solanum commersonii TaxID=4109 RepID=A0A9J6B1R8_SOLCO|nr:hypothetical protein H5410_002374 [Solanum commersonii]
MPHSITRITNSSFTHYFNFFHKTHSPLPINFYKKILYFPYPFNVTDWIIQHRGGDIPLPNHNGREATDAFIAFHPGTTWKHLDNLFTVNI